MREPADAAGAPGDAAGVPGDAAAASGDASPVKRKRGRPTKAEAARRLQTAPQTPPRVRRRLSFVVSDDSDDALPKAAKTASPKRKAARHKPPTPGAKIGRPSNRDKVLRQIDSVFSSRLLPEKVTTKKEQKPNAVLDFSGEGTYAYVAKISGIPAAPKAQEQEVSFVPMPIPEVDEEGNIADVAYLERWFPQYEAPQKARLESQALFHEGSEGYFEQQAVRLRQSAQSLSAHAPRLTYEEYIPMVRAGSYVHHRERAALLELHRGMFHQWMFELSQGYSVHLYGAGLKLALLNEFVPYAMQWYLDVEPELEAPLVMVVNGFNPGVKFKKVLHEISACVAAGKMPRNVSHTMPHLKRVLAAKAGHTALGLARALLILAVHNVDGAAFCDPRLQAMLSELAALPNVWLVCTSDSVNAGMLWDLHCYKNYNFVWHNATTYAPHAAEMAFRNVLSIGASRTYVGSSGVQHVLSSLTDNARLLYRILLQMQLAVLDSLGKTAKPNVRLGVPLTALRARCVDELVALNDAAVRSLLREYIEHKMCVLKKLPSGSEVVYVPFRYAEMAKTLRDEFGVEWGSETAQPAAPPGQA